MIAAIIIAAILAVILAALSGSEAVKLRKLRQSIEELTGSEGNSVLVTKDDVEALEKELSVLQGSATAREVGPADISETAALVRSLLVAHHIQPERFKINNGGENKPAEFVIRCEPLRFFSFLADASMQRTIEISSLSIRSNTAARSTSMNDTQTADITMRIRNLAPSRRDLPQSQGPGFSRDATFPDPKALALAFSPPRRAAPDARVPAQDGQTAAGPEEAAGGPEKAVDAEETLADGPELATVSPPEAIPAEEERRQFKPLGTIRDAGGREYLYGKDAESGGLVKIYSGVVSPDLDNQ
jgi:hypothetical protein